MMENKIIQKNLTSSLKDIIKWSKNLINEIEVGEVITCDLYNYIEESLKQLYKSSSNLDGFGRNNLVKELDGIVNNNNREKEQDYGPFIENIAKTARIASEITRKEFTTEDAFKFMMALKIARLAYGFKYDTYLDLTAYTAKLEQYLSNKEEIDNNIKNKL